MSKSRINLGSLLSGSGLSDAVAQRIFGGVESVEVDVMATAPGGLANDAAALHVAIEELIRTAPDTTAVRDFLAGYVEHEKTMFARLEQLAQGKINDR